MSTTSDSPAADAAAAAWPDVPSSAPSSAASGLSQNSIIGSGSSSDDENGASNSTASPAPAPVPDALLSLAKSARYTSYLSDLLGDLVAPYIPHFQKLQPEINLAAALLHAMLVVWRQGRSMGMDVTGLRFCSEDVLARRRKGGTKAGSSTSSGDGSGSWELAPADAQLISPPTTTASRMTTTVVPSSLSNESKSLPEQLGTYSKSLLFVALTVLPPYLAARCGRAGGWAELQSLLFPTSPDTNDSTTTTESSGRMDNTRHSGTANNDTVEHLRGKSRREIFEERRRAMMQMANQIESGDDIGSDTPMDNDGEAIREGGDAHTTHHAAVSGRPSQRDRVRQKYRAVLHRLCQSGTDWFRVSAEPALLGEIFLSK